MKKEEKDCHSNNNNAHYRSLSPRSDVENVSEYLAALSWAVNQNDVHNIAVSGPYGSGKSSVINTFLKANSNKKVLRISLAAFKFSGEGEPIHPEDQTEMLEEEILKQILYSVSSKKIPKSRYRKIASINLLSIIFPSFLSAIALLVALYFLQYDRITELADLVKSLPLFWAVIICVMVISLLVIAFGSIIKWIKENGKVKEVNLLDKTGIIFEGFSDNSVFNKNMDEIVYFFEKTKTEIVVIEDLDRYKKPSIFTDLRNLNTILNNNNKKRKIKFIYAIKDDLFADSKERTKFFDFIVPVVPVVSSSNSDEVLRELLSFDKTSDKSSFSDISSRFITLISPYINDMRDIICICNEFIVFKNTLKGNQNLDLKDEKMFALMVFKNLYPKDFSDLEDELDTSIVRKAFLDKQKIIDSKSKLIEQNRLKENKKLREIEADYLKSVKDLKSALLFSLVDPPEAVVRINIDGTTYTLNKILDDDFDMNMLKNNEFILYTATNTRRINNAESIIASRGNYFARIENVQKGIEHSSAETQNRISEFEREIGGVNSWPLKKAIDIVGIDFMDESIRSNSLLVFLFRNGYIDETYENYINYFRPNSISKEEMNYILGIRNHASNYAFSFRITNVAKVYERLMDYEFTQPEILNFDMVDYVLIHESESTALGYLLDQLSNDSEISYKFIKEYIDRGNCIDDFLRLLVKYNKHLWFDLTNDNTILRDKGYEYLNLLMNFCDTEDIVQQDLYDTDLSPVTTFIIEVEDSLAKLNKTPVEKLLSILDGLNIVFYRTDLKNIDNRIKEYIFQNNKYEMNVYMLSQLFEYKKPEIMDVFRRKNYTSIMILNYEPLSMRVANDFSKYISNVFLEIETNTEETVKKINEIIDALLPADYDLCIQVIEKSNATWKDINGCCSNDQREYGDNKHKIWKHLISHDRVSPNIENVMSYFILFAFDDELEGYFERHKNVLLEHINEPVVTEEFKNSLFHSDISVETFRQFIRIAVFDFTITDFEDLGKEKTAILIDEDKLKFSAQYWNKIHVLWAELSYIFAKKRADDFLAALPQINVDQDTLVALLSSNVFDETGKKEILSHFNVEQMSEEGAMLLSNIFFPIPRIYSDHAWKLLKRRHKIRLLIHQIENYSFSDLSNMFGELGDEYSTLVAGKRHQYSIPYNERNERLIMKLHSIGYVTSKKASSDNKVIHGFVKELS